MVSREDCQPNRAFAGWADALLSNPSSAVSDILEGRGARGALQLAEPGYFLADLLAQPSLRACRDALVEAIDDALIEWMEERVTWPPDRVARLGTRAYVAQFSDALSAVARLPLSSSPMHLLNDVGTWDDRFRSMRWPNDIDLLRQFDLALVQHQCDDRLASRWFASCEEAAWGGPYWRDSLGTALLGLRKIPDPTTTQPERLVATALARFAALASLRRTDSSELRAEFRHHVSTLAVLYPRHHSRWQETWASALASLRGFRKHRVVARDDWLRPALPRQCFPDIDSTRNEPIRRNWHADRRATRLPPRTELDRVILGVEAVQALDNALWRKAHSLLSRHWAYAQYTHNSHYAVRTTHNLCDRLLRKHPSEGQLAEIHNFTRQALQAEHGSAYIWDLWAKVLAAAGAHESALDVRWEAVRRFPDNLVTRMAMIVALASNKRHELAEHLFSETAQDFPNEVIEPRLLQVQRWAEAASEMSMDHPHGLLGELRRVIADEQFFCRINDRHTSMGPQLQTQLHSVLEPLSNRAVLLQRYFAPPCHDRVARETTEPSSPTSELELVVAYRTGSWPQVRDDILESWLNARPASYSLRLLALSRSINNEHGPDREEFARVQSAFPQHRHWNQWLGYTFAAPHRRTELRQQARDQGLWGGRLSDVYPDLDVPYSRPVAPKQGPLRRLFEDVALANANAGLPQL